MNLWKRLLGEAEPNDAEKSAVAAFLIQHPGERIAWTRLIAEEENRYIVGVFYGDVRPRSYQFFAIDRTAMTATVLEDDTAYRPKVWR